MSSRIQSEKLRVINLVRGSFIKYEISAGFTNDDWKTRFVITRTAKFDYKPFFQSVSEHRFANSISTIYCRRTTTKTSEGRFFGPGCFSRRGHLGVSPFRSIPYYNYLNVNLGRT